MDARIDVTLHPNDIANIRPSDLRIHTHTVTGEPVLICYIGRERGNTTISLDCPHDETPDVLVAALRLLANRVEDAYTTWLGQQPEPAASGTVQVSA